MSEQHPHPDHIAVIGAGRMGRGIALSFAYAGITVTLVDLKERIPLDADRLVQLAKDEIRADLTFMAQIDLLEADNVDKVLSRVSVLSKPRACDILSQIRIVFEAVPEIMQAKSDTYAWLNQVVTRTTLIASTTSTMGVNELAKLVNHPDRFLNAHWLNPAHLMPLVEVARGEATSNASVERLCATLKAITKIPVVCSASPGYIVPRIQALAMNEAARLAEEGVASVEDIDTALKVGFGLRFAVLGMLEFIDWGGNDILYHASNYLAENIDHARFAPPQSVLNNMSSGHNGLRDGVGFHDYRDRDVSHYRQQRLTDLMGMLKMMGLAPRPNSLINP